MQLEKESLCFSSFKFVVRLNHQTFDQSVILCYVSDIPSKKDWIFHCKVFFFINVSLAPIQTRPLIIQVNQQVNKQEGLSINQFPIVSAFKAFHWPWLHWPYYLLIKKVKSKANPAVKDAMKNVVDGSKTAGKNVKTKVRATINAGRSKLKDNPGTDF